MSTWTRIEPTETHKVGWRTVVVKHFKLPSGLETDFGTFGPEGQQHAAIIGLTSDHKVIVVRLFRPGPEMVMDELPGGMVEPGEDIAKAAKREFLEETGYEAGALEPLGAQRKDAYMNATWNYFFATNCKKVAPPKRDATEDIELRLVSIDEFIQNAKEGRMTDAVVLVAAYEKLHEIRRNI